MNKPVFYKILFIVFMFSQSVNAQVNLVPNGDFEFYTICPDFQFQTNRAFPWYDPNNNSSDYYNKCANNSSLVSIPNNFFGYQKAHSGNGYCGFSGACGPIGDCAEYIATPLLMPLVAGKEYCLSFWLSSADSACWANNGIGAYFSNDSITFSTGQIEEIGQISFLDVIKDTSNWVFLESSFIANGGEKFIAISNVVGNSFDTITICNSQEWSYSYYYIDDVKLFDCNETLQTNIEIPNLLTPNNDGVNDTWNTFIDKNSRIFIFNRWGQTVFDSQNNFIEWDGGNLISGVYFYKIISEKALKTGFIHLLR